MPNGYRNGHRVHRDTTPTTCLDIGDTTNGLKNSDGGFAKR